MQKGIEITRGDPFAPLADEPQRIAEERETRRARWNDFQSRTGGRRANWEDLSESRIFRPRGQGIWIDAVRTRGEDAPDGIGHSILLSRGYGEKPPAGERFIYRYPRPSRRSRQEIAAIKAANRFEMPLFVVDGITSPGSYTVHLGWVVDWHDEGQMFLFGRTPPSPEERANEDLDDIPFEETTTRRRAPAMRIVRPGQRDFKFDVISRYGACCAFCDMAVPDILRAAHIRPVQDDGSDDARNGLPLCENHHVAFDVGLVRIHPASLRLEVPQTVTCEALQLTRTDLKHLSKMPAEAALNWRYTSYLPYCAQQYVE